MVEAAVQNLQTYANFHWLSSTTWCRRSLANKWAPTAVMTDSADFQSTEWTMNGTTLERVVLAVFCATSLFWKALSSRYGVLYGKLPLISCWEGHLMFQSVIVLKQRFVIQLGMKTSINCRNKSVYTFMNKMLNNVSSFSLNAPITVSMWWDFIYDLSIRFDEILLLYK